MIAVESASARVLPARARGASVPSLFARQVSVAKRRRVAHLPERLLEGGATEFERRLLSALAAERPTPRLRAFIHRAVAFGVDLRRAPLSGSARKAFR